MVVGKVASLSSLHLCLGRPGGAGQRLLLPGPELQAHRALLRHRCGDVASPGLGLSLSVAPTLSVSVPAAFFFFLLRRCVDRGSPALFVLHVAKLGVAVVLAFAALWSPFCLARAADGEPCLTGLLHGAQLALPCANTQVYLRKEVMMIGLCMPVLR